MPLLFPHPIPKPKLCNVRRWSDVPVATSTSMDVPLGIVGDGSAGSYILTVEGGFTHWALRLRHVSAAGVSGAAVDVHRQTGLGTWYEASVAPADGGSCIVVWTQTNSPVVAERFDANLAKVWAAPAQLAPAANVLRTPVAAADGSGGVIAALYGSATTLVAQRVSAAGTNAWAAATTVVTGTLIPSTRAQVVTDSSGNATILWQTAQATGRVINAQRISSGGALAGGAFVVDTVADGWPSLAPVARAVPDGSGGFYAAFVPTVKAGVPDLRLTAVRYAAGATTPVWSKRLNLLANPHAFSVAEDGAGGLLLASISETNVVSAQRLDSSGADHWATSFSQSLNTINLQLPQNAFPHRFVFLTSIAARGAGDAVLIYQEFVLGANPLQHLKRRCLQADGSHVSSASDVSGLSGLQDQQLVCASDADSVNLAWMGDRGTATGFDVLAAKLGCCPPAPDLELQFVPSLFCEIPIDFPVMQFGGFGGFGVRLPCGNRDQGFFGLLPFYRLAEIPGVVVPGSFTSSGVKSPDWVRIWFREMPLDFDILHVDLKGKEMGRAEAYSRGPKGLEQAIGRTKVLTFKGEDAARSLLAFTLDGKVDQSKVHPIRIDVQFGHGQAPAIQDGKGPRPK